VSKLVWKTMEAVLALVPAALTGAMVGGLAWFVVPDAAILLAIIASIGTWGSLPER
jgi:uncharacterized membrane protein